MMKNAKGKLVKTSDEEKTAESVEYLTYGERSIKGLTITLSSSQRILEPGLVAMGNG